MARTVIPVTQITASGVALGAQVNADATNDHEVVWDSNTVLEVENVHATNAETVTFVSPGTASGLDISDSDKSIPALSTRYFSNLGDVFVTPDGKLQLNVAPAAADLRFRAFRHD